MDDMVQDKNINADCAMIGLWTANNYGSVLTAWSLYRELERLGCHPILIDHVEARNRHTVIGRFIRNRCNVTKIYNSSADMMELNDSIESFIVGSDQNWNDYWLEEIKGFAFFLDFVKENKRKISYATSFGNDDYKGLIEELDVIKLYLRRFDAISMRERGAAKLWTEILHRDIMCVIDPVFFTSADEYREVAKEYTGQQKETFLLQFILDISPLLVEVGKTASKALDVKLNLFMGGDYIVQGDLEIDWDKEEHPVEEALAKISSADYVLTDSFHVMCLAVIFRKPFACIANTRGRARIETVLQYLGLEETEYLLESDKLREINWKDHFALLQIDWEAIEKKLDRWREDSVTWLKNALNCPILNAEIDKDMLLMTSIDLAALGNRNAANGIKKIDDLLVAMNARFSYLEDILVELKEPLINARGEKIKGYLNENVAADSVIAIRGGGIHTKKLIELMYEILKEKNVQIKYIIDRNKAVEIELPEGCGMVSPEQFWSQDFELDAVVISSSRFKKEVLQEAEENNCGRYRIIDPYNAFEKDEVRDGRAWFD